MGGEGKDATEGGVLRPQESREDETGKEWSILLLKEVEKESMGQDEGG